MLARFCLLVTFVCSPALFAQTSISKSILMSRSANQPGTAANGTSTFGLGISDDGRFAIYRSSASDLDATTTDANGALDAVLFDRRLGTNKIISKRAAAPRVTGNGDSFPNDISADGRYILFSSATTNLLDIVDANGQSTASGLDLYLYDQQLDVLKLVNRSRSAVNPTTSDKGVSNGSGFNRPLIGDNGVWVAFVSEATDLVPSVAVSAGNPQLYLYNVNDDSIRMLTISAGSNTVASNASVANLLDISDHADYLLISSNASNLLTAGSAPTGPNALYLLDKNGTDRSLVTHIASDLNQACANAEPSGLLNYDGSQVAFSSNCATHVSGVTDTNATSDVFRYLRASGAIELVSHRFGQANVTANELSGGVGIAKRSNDVLFSSNASDLLAPGVDANNTTDAYIGTPSGAVELISINAAGTNSANSATFFTPDSISADGRLVAFNTNATNIVSGVIDENADRDVFVRDRRTSTSYLVSYQGANRLRTAQGGSGLGSAMTADGSSFIFGSNAPLIDPDFTDTNGFFDAHLAVENDTFFDGFDGFGDGFE
jgi:hypothetical protein